MGVSNVVLHRSDKLRHLRNTEANAETDGRKMDSWVHRYDRDVGFIPEDPATNSRIQNDDVIAGTYESKYRIRYTWFNLVGSGFNMRLLSLTLVYADIYIHYSTFRSANWS